MEEVIRHVTTVWEKNLLNFLNEKHGLEIQLLVRNFEKFLETRINTEELLFESKAVLERVWEELNVGKWSDVAEEKKQTYAVASYIQIMCLLHQNKSECIKRSLEITDMGILLGSPISSLSLTKVADILSSCIQETPSDFISSKRSTSERVESKKKIKLTNEIETTSKPSLEFFHKNFFTKNKPVKMLNCIEHWPALRCWQNLDYIVRKAGHRTVPIELGKHYADGSYSQKLMKVSDFVKEYFKGNAEKIGYLAQHQLFDQVPELKKDITEPDYCALSDKLESCGETEINAWFGPKGTVSPLHFDPKHNLLCQVVGAKKITLSSQEYTEFLYPHESSLLFNTSRVDVESPDLESFPEFTKAKLEECLLGPGEVLYIPPKYWHHVRALENSFSVSFWWE